MLNQQSFSSSSRGFLNSQSNGETSQEKQIELWGNSWQKLTPEQRELVDEILSDDVITMSSDSQSLCGLPEADVSDKTGLFVNPATQAVWTLSIRDQKLTIDVPNFSFQLSPSSSTKFLPVNPSIILEFEFEPPSQNHPCLMHIYAKGEKRASFEAL